MTTHTDNDWLSYSEHANGGVWSAPVPDLTDLSLAHEPSELVQPCWIAEQGHLFPAFGVPALSPDSLGIGWPEQTPDVCAYRAQLATAWLTSWSTLSGRGYWASALLNQLCDERDDRTVLNFVAQSALRDGPDDPFSLDLLTTEISEMCRSLRAALVGVLPTDTVDGMPAWDATLADWLEDLLAYDCSLLRERARTRSGCSHLDLWLDPCEQGSLWGRPTTTVETAWATTLAGLLWTLRVRTLYETKKRQQRTMEPATALALLEPFSCAWADSGSSGVETENGDVEFDSGTGIVVVLPRGVGESLSAHTILGSYMAHVFRHEVQLRALRMHIDPDGETDALTFQGGYRQMAEEFGWVGRKAANELKTIVEAHADVVLRTSLIDCPDGLLSRNFVHPADGRRAELVIIPGLVLRPHAVHRLFGRGKLLIPSIDPRTLPMPRRNEKGLAVALMWAIVSHIRQAADLPKYGAVKITERTWEKLMRKAGIKDPQRPWVKALRSNWVHGTDTKKPLLDLDGDRYMISREREPVRRFLLDGAKKHGGD